MLVTSTLEIDQRVYSLDLIKRVAYRFSDRVALSFQIDGDVIKCHFALLDSSPEKSFKKIIEDFHIELLDQDLRVKIATETAPIRNAVLALTFSKTGLQSSE